MKKISIVIPVYNEEYFISGLLESISRINYPMEDYEVNVVCDGCTDGTVAAVKKYPFVRLIEQKVNIGRYEARKIGAEAATYPNILFIDARCVADPDILSVIDKSTEKVIIGRVLSDDKPGLFETFYISMRRKIFSNYYENPSRIIELTEENFDSLPKGTTVLFVKKDVLLQAFEDLSHVKMGKDSSDDTKLLKEIIHHTSAIIHPDLKIINFYRKTFLAGLDHLAIYNASSFVDYYLRPSQRFFWLVIVFPLLALLSILIGLIFIPISGFVKFATLVGIDLIITTFLAKTFREFYIILFMLPLSVSAFYFGIVRAIFIKSLKSININK